MLGQWSGDWITEEEMYPYSRITEEYEDCEELTVWDYWKEDYYMENKDER